MAASNERLCIAMPHGSRCAYPKVGDGSYCHIHSPDAKKRQADAEAAANAERQREFEKFDRLAKLKPNKPKKPNLTVAIEGPAGTALSVQSPRIDTPISTPKFQYSRKDAPAVGVADENVTWRGSLSVVLDIDETLVAALEGHPDMPLDSLDVKEISLNDGGPDDKMLIALRPWATRFLFHLNDQGFEVYLLTAGSQEYCDAVVTLFNELATQSGQRPVIIAGASCRDAAGRVRPKEFGMVLPPSVLPEYAIGVDNKRLCWRHDTRDQIIITADYLPEWTRGQKESVLMQVLDRLLHISYYFEQHYAETQEFKRVGDILSLLYENELKQSMINKAASFTFTHPESHEPGSFLEFLAERD